MDKTENRWKTSIAKYAIIGDHYFTPSGWKGPFSDFVDLNWVPRYIVVDPTRKMTLFRALTANDLDIRLHLN